MIYFRNIFAKSVPVRDAVAFYIVIQAFQGDFEWFCHCAAIGEMIKNKEKVTKKWPNQKMNGFFFFLPLFLQHVDSHELIPMRFVNVIFYPNFSNCRGNTPQNWFDKNYLRQQPT